MTSPKDGKMDGGWTPGPWSLGYCDKSISFVNAGPSCVARMDEYNHKANARLIAAAPCLNEGGRNLANEVAGLKAFEPEIRAVIGNTNWNVLMQREEELRAAIHRARSTGEA